MSNDNWVSKTAQSYVASAGSMAGNVVDSAGKTVEGAGRGVGQRYHSPFPPFLPTCPLPPFPSLPKPPTPPKHAPTHALIVLLLCNSITNAATGAGGTVSDYGNGVKDWTKADGSRAQTAKNPVGTSGSGSVTKGAAAGAGKGNAAGKGGAQNPLGLNK